VREHIVARLMEVQRQFPNMTWDFDEYGFLCIRANIFPEERDFLEQGRRMFEPA